MEGLNVIRNRGESIGRKGEGGGEERKGEGKEKERMSSQIYCKSEEERKAKHKQRTGEGA